MKPTAFFNGVIVMFIALFGLLLVMIGYALIQTEPWYKKVIITVGIGLIGFAALKIPISLLEERYQQGIGKENARAVEAFKFEQAGVASITGDWTEYKSNVGHGKYLKERLNNFAIGSTWCIITINPVGLMGDFLDEIIRPALKSGTRLKWSYVKLPRSEGPGNDVLINWWDSQYALGRNQDKNTTFGLAERNINTTLENLKRCLEEDITRGLYSVNNVSLYESSIPTTFLCLLAQKDVREKSKRTGIVMVYPYVMFPAFEENHWGMLLESGGEIYEQYSRSIARYFEEGERKGYLKKVWPNKLFNNPRPPH